jgi:hypothetical protein
MTKPIRTYEDLVQQKNQVEALLQAQKELLIYDLRQLQTEFKSATSGLSIVGNIVTRKKQGFMVDLGVNKMIDFLFKKLILSRSGWITRLAVPFIVKNISSHLISNNKEQIVEKIKSWLHKSSNGKAAPEMHHE